MACVTYIEAYVEMSILSSLATVVRNIVFSVLLRVFFEHNLLHETRHCKFVLSKSIRICKRQKYRQNARYSTNT